MQLNELVKLIKDYKTEKFENVEITGLSYNSKNVKNGDLFICIRGEASDGHNYAQNAVDNGAKAIFCEEALSVNVPQIIVNDTKRTMANIAAAFYNEPSKSINLIGVIMKNVRL